MWTALLIVSTTALGYYLGGHYPDTHGEFHQYLGAIVGFIVGTLVRFGGSGVGEGIGDAFDGFGD